MLFKLINYTFYFEIIADPHAVVANNMQLLPSLSPG